MGYNIQERTNLGWYYIAKLCKVLRNILDKPQHFTTYTQTNRCTSMYTSAFQNTRCASWQTPKHLVISTNDLYKVNDQTLKR